MSRLDKGHFRDRLAGDAVQLADRVSTDHAHFVDARKRGTLTLVGATARG